MRRRQGKRVRPKAPSSFEEVYSELSHKSWLLCKRLCRDSAEDAHQDTWLQIHRKLHTFRGECALSSWVFRVTFNCCMMLLRRERGYERADAAGRAAFREQSHSSMVKDMFYRQRIASLQETLNRLQPMSRQVFILSHVEGFGAEQIAKMWKTSVPCIKSRLFRARRFVERSHGVEFPYSQDLDIAA